MRLKELTIARNTNITDISVLSGMPLQSLDLSQSGVANLCPLSGMTTLTALTADREKYWTIFAPAFEAAGRGDLDAAVAAVQEARDNFSEVAPFADVLAKSGALLGTFAAMKAGTAAPVKPAIAPDAKAFGGHHYALGPFAAPWTIAEAYSKQQGGHLATVSSQEENAEVIAMFGVMLWGESIWLGGVVDAGSPGGKWITGEPFVFKCWSPELRNSPVPEGAVQLWHKNNSGWCWSTDSPDDIHNFVIEWDQ